jgi:ligand-binding SRPBCC domain-containing protein
MKDRIFRARCRVPLAPEKVFPFFGDVVNLDRITPPWLQFRILPPVPAELSEGARIEYALRIRGLPVRWTTEIRVWEPPRRFVDVQLRGPYRKWEHEHLFTPDGDGTLIEDRVVYRVPGWILEPLIHRWFVARDVERIFDYRGRRTPLLLQQESRERALLGA